MKTLKPTIPSPTELSILKVIWLKSPLSAKEIHQLAGDDLNWSFSSTRKTLDRMETKDYIHSSQVHGVRVFKPKLKKLKTLALYAYDFARRVLELDGPLPVSMFVDSKLVDQQEVQELEKIIAELETKAGKESRGQ